MDKYSKHIVNLRNKNIKILVFDFDLTILRVHSGGAVMKQWVTTVSQFVSKDWISFIKAAIANGFEYHIATFSDSSVLKVYKLQDSMAGKDLVTLVLRVAFARENIRNIEKYMPRSVIGMMPQINRKPELFTKLGLKKPPPPFKTFHLKHIQRMTRVSNGEMVLYDDDMNNVKAAAKEGYHAYFIPCVGQNQCGFDVTTIVAYKPKEASQMSPNPSNDRIIVSED